MSIALRVEFLAWHSEHPLALRDIEARLDAVEGFYPHSQFRRSLKIGANRHTGLAAWLPKVGPLAALAGFAGDALAVASHFPFGLSQHVAVAGNLRPQDIDALHEKVRRAPETMQSLAPPLCLVQLSASGSLHLSNDFRGFAEVFHFAGKGLQVWSNRLSMPLVFALEDPQDSELGAQLRAVFSYFPRTHTPFANVDRVEGGTTVFAGDWPARPLVSRRKLLLEMLSQAAQGEGAQVDYKRCVELAASAASEAQRFWSGPIRSGLTGGRDSRAVLALLIAAGQAGEVELSTIKIHKHDYEPAAALVESCKRHGQDVTWQLGDGLDSTYSNTNPDGAWEDFPAGRYRRRNLIAALGDHLKWSRTGEPADRPGLYSYHVNPLLDRMVFQFHRLDGQTMPLGYYTTPEAVNLSGAHHLLLGGQSGEVLRASGYGLDNLAGGPDDWLKRLARGQYRPGRHERSTPTTDEARQLAQAEWMQYIEEAREAGLTGFKVLDYLGVAGKQSRRIDVPKLLLLACPLAHPALLTESYKLPAEARARNAFHRGLIGAAAPYLLDVPFSFELPKEAESQRMDLRDMPQFWHANAVPGFGEIVRESWRWADTFDEDLIEAEFGETAEPTLTPYHRDMVAGYLLWRSAQGAYVKVVSAYIAGKRRSVAALLRSGT